MESIILNEIGLVEVSKQPNNIIEAVFVNLDKEIVTDYFNIKDFDIENDNSIKTLETIILGSDKYFGDL